jgi:hypothetical protein
MGETTMSLSKSPTWAEVIERTEGDQLTKLAQIRFGLLREEGENDKTLRNRMFACKSIRRPMTKPMA